MIQGKMICYFIADQQSDFYSAPQFSTILDFVKKNANLCKMKEKQTTNGLRLLLTFENIKSLKRALEVMEMV